MPDADPRPDSPFAAAAETLPRVVLDPSAGMVLCETMEPHGHLPAWIETPPASLGLGDPEAVLRALRALDDADRARVIEALRESDARRARDHLVARLSVLADHARNGAQMLEVPAHGFPPGLVQDIAGACSVLGSLARTADRCAESAAKAGA